MLIYLLTCFLGALWLTSTEVATANDEPSSVSCPGDHYYYYISNQILASHINLSVFYSSALSRVISTSCLHCTYYSEGFYAAQCQCTDCEACDGSEFDPTNIRNCTARATGYGGNTIVCIKYNPYGIVI